MAKGTYLLAALGALQCVQGFMLPTSHTTQRLGTSSLNASPDKFALLFDCDGVIIETEELHRLAYNAAFKEFNLQIDDEPVEWSVAYYDILQNTGKWIFVTILKQSIKFHLKQQSWRRQE